MKMLMLIKNFGLSNIKRGYKMTDLEILQNALSNIEGILWMINEPKQVEIYMAKKEFLEKKIKSLSLDK